MAETLNVPTWNLDDVFPGFESEKYREAKVRIKAMLEKAKNYLVESSPPVGDAAFADWLWALLAELDQIEVLADTLSAYVYARFSTETKNPVVIAELNKIEELLVPATTVLVQFRNMLAQHEKQLKAAIASDARFAPYAFVLEEALFFQKHQMAPELEDLAADLGRSGADAWSRLQESILANTSAVWDEATGERKTMVELRNLAYDPDRAVREKAYRLELGIWKSVEMPVAAALNGVKGTVSTLNKRRGWESALEASLAQARISRATLDALIGAMEVSLPMWRRYLKAKARLLGLERVAFYDLFGPVERQGAMLPTFQWNEARDFIVRQFGTFDPDMAAFAAHAFEHFWIDAKPREGKSGGAYCTHFPAARQPRVFCNFDGSFSSLGTIAHELGHAWHYETIKDLPMLLSQYPMTLAETASIFSETLVSNAAMAELDQSARLPLIEMHLQDACQVIVDILSRFYFEKAVFEERANGEITADRLCALMLDAQNRTYGVAMEPELKHPYMWAVKGHYYIPSLSFYNFPYAFGQLFGVGLYQIYKEQGSSFARRYRELLRATGSLPAVEVARKAGFDIETPDFWLRAMSTFEEDVRFLEDEAQKSARE
ncbi:MAG TPA: peptidase M3 [Spirochaetaceae bacterium]|jgi:pepF/M3 family oligoendopeptidase|nr:peptidase M3 [Spirochaetaceae bacterium]